MAHRVAPRPIVRSLPFDKSKDGRIQVDPFLRGTAKLFNLLCQSLAAVINQKSVYALGDCAFVNEKPLPCTAQAADQQAKYLAKTLNLEAANKQVRRICSNNVCCLGRGANDVAVD